MRNENFEQFVSIVGFGRRRKINFKTYIKPIQRTILFHSKNWLVHTYTCVRNKTKNEINHHRILNSVTAYYLYWISSSMLRCLDWRATRASPLAASGGTFITFQSRVPRRMNHQPVVTQPDIQEFLLIASIITSQQPVIDLSWNTLCLSVGTYVPVVTV